MTIASEVVKLQQSRLRDAFGSGQYRASRGTRKHAGIDIVTAAGETIFAPITGSVVRQAFPYKSDKNYVGVVIKGSGDWQGYEVKIFYVEGLFSGPVSQGEVVGLAQDLTKKYPGITNHVHLEARLNGKEIDPRELWQMSF
jgi:hypothetical protein